MTNAQSGTARESLPPAGDDLLLTVDGREPVTPGTVAAIGAVCDAAEDRAGRSSVVVRVSGTPGGREPGELTVALVGKWERALGRLARLPALTVAVADGDCGGPALDAFLATDYRIATGTVRLVPTVL